MDYLKYIAADLSNSICILAYVADVCNYNCEYCYNKKPRSNTLLDLHKLSILIDKLYQQTHKDVIVDLIGGETTMHPDLLSFMSKKHKGKVTYLVYSNFSKDVDYYRKILENNNAKLFLSWHHNNCHFVEKLNSLSSFKNQLSVSVMYEFGYTDLALDIFEKCKSLAHKYSLTLIDNNLNIYSDNEQKKYLTVECIDDIDYQLKLNGNIMQISEEKLVNDNLASFYHWMCEAGNTYIYVHYDGNVYPCQNYISDSKQKAMFNITNIYKLESLPLCKTLCKFKTCECGFSAYKYNVFTK